MTVQLNIKTSADLAADAQEALHKKSQTDAMQYLTSTDWYVTRASEPNGKPVPKDILKKRMEAREVLK